MKQFFLAAALALSATAATATTIFEDTPNETAGGFDITPIAPSSLPGNSDIYVGSVFGAPGVGFAISGKESFEVTLAGGGLMASFSFDIYQPSTPQLLEGCNTTCVDSEFTLEAFRNGVLMSSSGFIPSKDAVFGFGILPGFIEFDMVRVTEIVGTNDNEFFANFSADLAPIPLPAGGLLLLSGIGLGAALRRRR